jgi:hypothetical protein
MSDNNLLRRLRNGAIRVGQDIDNTDIEQAADRIEALTAERDEWKEAATSRHPNPADHRYWEGRYPDEKARAEAAEAERDAAAVAQAKG